MLDEPLSRLIASLSGRSVVLLQGPVGPFFRYLADALSAAGARVRKVNFNAGDRHFFDDARTVDYAGTPQALADFYRELFRREAAEAVFVFGDERPVHVVAREIATELGVEIYAFEEGYLRPDYITLERGGVNARSAVSGDPQEHVASLQSELPEVRPVGSTFGGLAWHSAVYGLAFQIGRGGYPHYTHHKDIHPVREAGRWVLGGVRKARWKLRDRGVEARFSGELSGKYFLVPLQVWNDFQIRGASFSSVERFTRHVVATFARVARPDEHLVLKHHPMDRPYRDYTQLIAELRREHGLGERLHYVADSHLPTMLKHARGTILINSTVGMSSLHHGTPVFATDPAPYTRAGLAYEGSLEDFIRDPGSVDRERVRAFEAYLRHTCQVNGSFYVQRALPAAVRGGGDSVDPDAAPAPSSSR